MTDETVPKWKFDALVLHCKLQDERIADLTRELNDVLYYKHEPDSVWYWQGDGEDFLRSLSCPILIRPNQLRNLLRSKGIDENGPLLSPDTD